MIKKDVEKFLKYKDVTIPLQRIRNVKNKNYTGNNRDK